MISRPRSSNDSSSIHNAKDRERGRGKGNVTLLGLGNNVCSFLRVFSFVFPGYIFRLFCCCRPIAALCGCFSLEILIG